MATRRKKEVGAERLREMMATRADEAVEVLLTLMRDEGQKPELRMKAAEGILDRVFGKGSVGEPKSELPQTLRFEGVLEEWSR
ncbi:MAG: hypothetical protein J6L87_00205 [Clostridia bacterium]|nr:hypothetical protein [Clostridia bacterium]MBQ8339663.1 hypothetical protein [Clostridia bacterium]